MFSETTESEHLHSLTFVIKQLKYNISLTNTSTEFGVTAERRRWFPKVKVQSMISTRIKFTSHDQHSNSNSFKTELI